MIAIVNKMEVKLLCTVYLIFLGFCSCDEESDITKFMKHLEVIPDVIDIGPKDFLKVSYNNNVQADKGVELTPTQVKDQPMVEWKADKDSFYTLIMTDPDAPSRKEPKFREWMHWVVVNIPENNIDKGEVLTQYIGAGPPKGTGLHRYVLLVYKQDGKLVFDEPKLTNTNGDNRTSFSTKKFIAKYKMDNLVAGNFFQAQYDDYVPKLYAQLGN